MQSWFLLVGAVLIAMALAGRWVQRLPLSPAIIYLGVGWVIGPGGLGLLPVDPIAHAHWLELLAEVAVLIALFSVGLRLRVSFRSDAWKAPVRLAGLGMVMTTVLAALAGHALLGLPLAAALLLGAVLAPTDPVLASDVQIVQPGDRDAVRFSLTAEGGLNDGTAFPAVMLALGLLGTHDIGRWAVHWWTIDLLWAVVGGLAIGWACGLIVGRLAGSLRATDSHPESEEFIVLGTIAFAYGLALAMRTYGFLAVFMAAAALAHVERQCLIGVWPAPAPAERDDATHSRQLIRFAGQCERLLEVAVVLVIGAALYTVQWTLPVLLFAAAMLLVVRPLAVLAVVPRRLVPRRQRRLVAWFGVRGVGSVYYLMYALDHGVPREWAPLVVEATLVTIAASIVVHGVSATPLMERYRRHPRRHAGCR